MPPCWNWQTDAICNRVLGSERPGPIPGGGIPPSGTNAMIEQYAQKTQVEIPQRKRGPKEERLVITDPQKALDKLLRPKPPKG